MSNLTELIVVLIISTTLAASSVMTSSLSQSSAIPVKIEALKVYNLLEYAVTLSSEIRNLVTVEFDAKSNILSLKQSDRVHQQVILTSSGSLEIHSGYQGSLAFYRSLVSSPARVTLKDGIAECSITISLRTRLRLRCSNTEDR